MALMLELECDPDGVQDMEATGHTDGGLTEFKCPECGESYWERLED